jgi:hypothetical protein
MQHERSVHPIDDTLITAWSLTTLIFALIGASVWAMAS